MVMANRPAVVAIDSPRSCAPEGQSARDGELQPGKSICGTPLWTPDAGRVQASAYYAWILEGHTLFDAMAVRGVEVIEVFPTPHGLAGMASEARGPARPGLGRDWQPSVCSPCPRARTKTSETLLPLR
jgi:hypothetical protein